MSVSIKKIDNFDPIIQVLLKDLDKECLPGCPDMEVNQGAWWLAFDGNDPIGYAGIRPSFFYKKQGYMNRAGVLPAYRGKGIQKLLIKKRLAYARKIGWERVVTDTAKANVASSNSLIACGFRLYRPDYYWSFESALYWYKDLT